MKKIAQDPTMCACACACFYDVKLRRWYGP